MAWLPLIILALVQGITEFLPISSSGHLLLVHHYFGDAKNWEQHMVLDVAVHVGTLFSVLLYFREDVAAMLKACTGMLTRTSDPKSTRLIKHLIIASIPVILAGLALQILKSDWVLLLQVTAWATLIFGIALWVADISGEKSKTLDNMTLKHAILIGLAQALALIPGTSRSGITMTAARFLGYSRTESAHFSLLLAIIAIAGAGTLGALQLIESGNTALGIDALIATLLAFISGWIAIALMMKWLEKSSFAPFAIYRIILGIILLIISYQVI